MKKAQLLVLLNLLLVAPEIKGQISVNPIQNFIYTSQLGPARIPSTFHKFIHFFNLTDLNTEIRNNENVLFSLKNIIENKSYQKNYVRISLNLLLTNMGFEKLILHNLNQISEIKNRIAAFSPSRTRRGLINPIGNIYSYLFGTMDNDDKLSINKALSTLEENQFKISKRIETQTSITTKLLEHYNRTISTLVENQNTLVKQLEKALSQLSNITNEHQLITKIQNIFSQLYMNLDKIKEFVMTIENAISFAHLKELHPAILPRSDLALILKELELLFPPEQIIHFKDFRNYYRIFSIKIHVEDNIIYFVIYAPIFDTAQYNYFHSCPIPWKNHTVIIPHPYVLMSLNTYMVPPESCPEVENIYICKGQPQPLDDSCEIAIITKGDPSRCPIRTSILFSNIIEQISQDKVIVVPLEPVKIPFSCEISSGIQILTEPCVIHIPEDCQVTITGRKFFNSKELVKAMQFSLPAITIPVTVENSTLPHIQLKQVKLDEISELHKMSQELQPLDLSYIHHNVRSANIGLILITISITISILVMFLYKYRIKWFRQPPRVSQTPGDVELQSNPEVSSRQGGVMFITT